MKLLLLTLVATAAVVAAVALNNHFVRFEKKWYFVPKDAMAIEHTLVDSDLINVLNLFGYPPAVRNFWLKKQLVSGFEQDLEEEEKTCPK